MLTSNSSNSNDYLISAIGKGSAIKLLPQDEASQLDD